MKTRAKADSTSSGADEGWAVLTTLIGGFVVWGGIGWLLDRWLGTAFLTPIGLILGMALGIYAVVAKYGRLPQELAAKPVPPTQPSSPGQPPAGARRENECP